MTELRWGLLVLGLVTLAAIYFYTRHRSALRSQLTKVTRPRSPGLGGETPLALSLVDETNPDTGPTKVITVRMMARGSRGFQAEQLILAMRESGLRHGQFGIFHKINEDVEGASGFSVASLVEPGSFDLTRIKIDFYPGVSIFMRLPGPRDGLAVFDEMLETARTLAKKMDGDLLDEHGSTLSVQRERYIREEVIQFEHQGHRP